MKQRNFATTTEAMEILALHDLGYRLAGTVGELTEYQRRVLLETVNERDKRREAAANKARRR